MRTFHTAIFALVVTALCAIAALTATAQPSNDPLNDLNRRIQELHRAGKFREALPLAESYVALARERVGERHTQFEMAIVWLGTIYQEQGRYAEAEPLLKRALAISEATFGPTHPNVGIRLSNLGVFYRTQSRLSEAEPLYKRALTIAENALGPTHVDVSARLSNLAELYRAQGRYAEAEPLFKRALTIMEQALGQNHQDVGLVLSNFANFHREQGHHAEAEALHVRALAIREKALGADHPQVAISLNNLAELYRELRRYAEAEPLYKRALSITEKALGPTHPTVGVRLNNLAVLHQSQGRFAEAEALQQRALSIAEKAFGADHPSVAVRLNNLALLYQLQARYADAEPLYMRALNITTKTMGSDHPSVGIRLHNVATMSFAQGDWAKAAVYWRQSTDLLVRRSRRGAEAIGTALVASSRSEAEREGIRFAGLIKATHRRIGSDSTEAARMTRDMFEAAQWAQSSQAAASLSQMSARQAKGDGPLARLVRERQDLVGEWQGKEKLMLAAISQPPERRHPATEDALRARLSAIDARITAIDKSLAQDFPDYAAAANPEPLTIADVQSALRAEEALVLFFSTAPLMSTPEEIFTWAITKTASRWTRSELRGQRLEQRVAALRCGLDQVAWDGDGDRCGRLLGVGDTAKTAVPGQLPFDLARAHELYQVLFGQIEDLVRDKQLLIVPSGPLTAIPLQVLITDKPPAAISPNSADYANAAWLANRHTMTVLPSVASLKALRQFAKASKATQPFIGFGNPLLTGPSGTDRRAWERQSCASPAAAMQIASRGVRGTISKFFRSGLANVEEVRAQYPLPETADELCAVARSSGATEGVIYLGEKATEKTIKALSANGTLARARVVHFATHGLLAGETELLATSRAEPALILTPPKTATEDDDGLLTASEITQLKLDADWVVLSACNTAAGETNKPGTEALSGLARAFFYAGARALLVSHWAVNSEATVHLITKAFDELKANPKIGRAEALRRSMLVLIARGNWYAHPANWAPFVVVGEGAR